VGAGACLFAIAFYASMQGTYSLELFSNFGLIAYMGSAAIVGIAAFARLGRSRMTYVPLGFAMGLVFWLLGLLVYSDAYYISGTGLPYISLADVFYMLTYPAMLLGALGMLRIGRRSVTRNGWVIVLVLGLLLYMLDVGFVIPLSIEDLTTPLEIIVTILYPTLDILVFLVLLPIFFLMRKGVFEKAFAFISLGAVLLALGDLFYTTLNVASLYYDGHPVDLLLFFGCVSAGYGFWRQYADLKAVISLKAP
jgi:hypothetical protein